MALASVGSGGPAGAPAGDRHRPWPGRSAAGARRACRSRAGVGARAETVRRAGVPGPGRVERLARVRPSRLSPWPGVRGCGRGLAHLSRRSGRSRHPGGPRAGAGRRDRSAAGCKDAQGDRLRRPRQRPGAATVRTALSDSGASQRAGHGGWPRRAGLARHVPRPAGRRRRRGSVARRGRLAATGPGGPRPPRRGGHGAAAAADGWPRASSGGGARSRRDQRDTLPLPA